MSRQFAQWLLKLSEFDILVMTPKGLRSQVLSNMLAQFSSGEHEPLYEDLYCEEIYVIEDNKWVLPSPVFYHQEAGQK